jgi:glycosyltransferase involved in cell wall biosynthesis
MRILLVHNRYRIAGGEDAGMHDEIAMLKDRNHEIALVEADNMEISGALSQLKTGVGAIYSRRGKQRVAAELARFRPDVMHVHNFFPLFSPSIYSAAHEAGVAVVQTLHNYRLVCPNAMFLRNGHVCEDCFGAAIALPGVIHACYRGSRLATVPVAVMEAVHRAMGTWRKGVDAYITRSEFARQKLAASGLPADRMFVQPSFVHPAPPVGDGDGGYALFVGRLSQEKGISTLLAAWKQLAAEIPLKIVGDGPMAEMVKSATDKTPAIEWLGRIPREQVATLMRHASVLVFPSIWYETFGLVMVEAFAVGLPVVASNLGTMSTLVQHGRTGLHFRPGDPEDLVAQVRWARSHPKNLREMRQAARQEYEAKYTAERVYGTLVNIYLTAMKRVRAHAHFRS